MQTIESFIEIDGYANQYFVLLNAEKLVCLQKSQARMFPSVLFFIQ